MTRRLALAVLPLVLLVAPLAACTESARIPPPEPSSAIEPLFASDEEALAAATEAYEVFLRVSGEILRDGGSNPDRLQPLVSEAVFETEAQGFDVLLERGWRATGESVLVGIELQQHLVGPAGVAEVAAYVCVSVEGNDIVDANGQSQVAPDRPVESSFEVVYSTEDDGSLVLERKNPWSDEVACS